MGRPTSVTVFAILNILYGLLLLCGGVFGIVASIGMILAVQQNSALADAMGPGVDMFSNPIFATLSIVSQGLSVLLGIAAFASAIGLLMMRHWARRLTFLYGIGLIIVFLINVVTQIAMYAVGFNPMAEAQSIPGLDMNLVMIASLIFGIVSGLVFNVVYPALMIYFLRRPHVLEAFRLANWDATVEAEEAS